MSGEAAASEEARHTVGGMLKPLNDARIKPVGFFNIRYGDYSKTMRDPGDFILKICRAL